MEEFINFLGDFLLWFITCLVFSKGIIKITVHHINENIVPSPEDLNMDKLEDEMLDEHQDPKDELYETKAIMNDVIDTMGGSDRL